MRRLGRGVLPRRATIFLEFFTALVTALVVVFGLAHHFFDDGGGQHAYPGEGRRIVAFRQVANRICEENTENMRRALRKAGGRIQLLTYLRRAIGWDVHDLTTITPPPTVIEDFLNEVSARRHVGADLRQLKRAAANYQPEADARILLDLRRTEADSAELSGALGLPRCTRVLLSLKRLSAS